MGDGNSIYPYKYVTKVLHFSKICKFFSKKNKKITFCAMWLAKMVVSPCEGCRWSFERKKT